MDGCSGSVSDRKMDLLENQNVFENRFPPNVLSALWEIQMAGMNFQTRSSTTANTLNLSVYYEQNQLYDMGEYQLLYWKICLKYFLEKYRADCVRCSIKACLKIHSRQVHASLCGIFGYHSVNAAHYTSLIRAKSPTNCDAHLTESNFKTRSAN